MCGEEFLFCVDAGSLGWLVLSHLLVLAFGFILGST